MDNIRTITAETAAKFTEAVASLHRLVFLHEYRERFGEDEYFQEAYKMAMERAKIAVNGMEETHGQDLIMPAPTEQEDIATAAVVSVDSIWLADEQDDPRETATQRYYRSVNNSIKEDVVEALCWAKKHLESATKETGFFFQLVPQDGGISCAFAPPHWGGDHCGRPMDSGGEAVVMAVAEFINGF